MIVTDSQVRRLRRLDTLDLHKREAARRAGIDEKTARKYRRLGLLPSEVYMDHTWRTRPDPFADVWPRVEEQLAVNPGLEAKTLFGWLQREYPGRFAENQLRTLQRRIKQWRALEGSPKEVFFRQMHHPGRLCASDFTHCDGLEITLGGQAFPHLIFHFVLTYSNWETGTICFSESFESLSEGLQNALSELGGVPEVHRTDSLTAAVPPGEDRPAFQKRYAELLAHYGLQGQAINPTKAHENGDVEQSHRQFKRALDQALLLRGSRDFARRGEYEEFLRELFAQLNRGRQARLIEELAVLRPLPSRRLDACKRLDVRVDSGSTIHVQGNTYSVHSRLIGEWVEVRVFADHLEVWYAQRRIEWLPRLRGRGKHRIDYRHIIDWLVRKPGAFADYCYREELFPGSRFRLAYDTLMAQHAPRRAVKEYLAILRLAARGSESGVGAALERLRRDDGWLSAAAVEELLRQSDTIRSVTAVTVAAVDLRLYDALLDGKEAEHGEGTEREGDVGGLPQGIAPAHGAVELRGAGPPSAAGSVELRALSAGVGAAGSAATAEQSHREAAPRVAVAAGEELAGAGPEAAAPEGAATSPAALGRIVRGPARERVDFWECGLGQDALAGGDCSGVGAGRPENSVHDLQPAGAGIADRQARPEAEPAAEAVGGLSGAADRRPGLCATKPGGDGGVVHAAGGAVRARQRAADEQPAVLAMGTDLQGPDDDGGGHRSAGASQRDPGVELAELSSGASEEGEGERPTTRRPGAEVTEAPTSESPRRTGDRRDAAAIADVDGRVGCDVEITAASEWTV